MHSAAGIEELARAAASKFLGPGTLEKVLSEPATDSEGNDALRITLVLKAAAAKLLSGDAALNVLVAIQQKLRDVGEERFPIVEYATQAELDIVADPQS